MQPSVRVLPRDDSLVIGIAAASRHNHRNRELYANAEASCVGYTAIYCSVFGSSGGGGGVGDCGGRCCNVAAIYMHRPASTTSLRPISWLRSVTAFVVGRQRNLWTASGAIIWQFLCADCFQQIGEGFCIAAGPASTKRIAIQSLHHRFIPRRT
jgi:hypothetical protein